MQTPDSQMIVSRFFEALDKIIEYKIIRGKQTFTREYNINRWQFNLLKNEIHRDSFQTAWLTYLVKDFMISPRWLLTGEGEMFEYGWDADKVRDLYKRKREISKAEAKASDKSIPKRGRPRKVAESSSQAV